MGRYLKTRARHIPWQAVQLPILTKDGREIPTEISFGEFASGGRLVFSGIIRDVSERVVAEAALAATAEQLRNQALELEQQVEAAQTLGEELEQTNQELSEANTRLQAAREQAQDSATRVREVLDSLSDAVSVFDRDWRWTYVNPSARVILTALGRDPNAVIGEVLWQQLPDLLGTPFETENRRALETQSPVTYEEYLPALDRWFENRIVPFANGVTTFTRDVTEQRRAAEVLRTREAEYRALVNSIPTLAWMARPDGWIFWYNDRWYEYTGTTRQQVEGWGWQSVHDPATLPAVLRRWRVSISTGEPFEMTFPLRGADGQFRPFLTRVVPVRDAEGHVTRWFGTNTDVEPESRLRQEAEAANRAKSDFLGVMSHELRTPLNAIGGYAELIELGLHGPVTEQQLEDLHRIQQSQRHLLGLINQVLNYTRVEAGTLRYELADVPVGEALAAAEALVVPQVRARGLTYVLGACNATLRVSADREKLQQILLNLLTNAIKFTEPGGEIRVACIAQQRNVAISITDTGLGIAADKLASVFEPFVQVDQRLTRAHEGVGLGLAISRDLARGMGGDLAAESTPDSGSTFTLTLPRA
jgi:PAS domain S-box-containing protein